MSGPPTIRKHKAEIVFEQELEMIGDDGIREFIVDVFKKFTPDYFWTVPCSTSGKYHPKISLGEGGLVRHTKLAVWWAVELMRSMLYFDQNPGMSDIVIAAVLLHDLKKNGEKLDHRGYPTLPNATASHGLYLAKQIQDEFCSSNAKQYVIPRIIDGIKYHMGRWTQDAPDDWHESVVNQVVHLADYCASRKVDGKMEELMSND